MTTSVGSHTGSRVLVIGAGVVGLTTALRARQAGHAVTVVAERFAPDITSVIAGALWEWPPAVCGHHRDEESLVRSKTWCMASYRRFIDLAEVGVAGVFVRPAVFYFRNCIDDDPIESVKVRELSQNVAGFRRDQDLGQVNGINPDVKVRDAYTYLAPMIDTEAYLSWLMDQVKDIGCEILQARIEGDLAEREHELLDTFRADAIVNCTGLGAIELAGKKLYPLRGSLIHAHNDGNSMPRITSAHCMPFNQAVGGQNMIFIVPRGSDRLVLGGLVEPDEWDTGLTFESYAPVREMLARCQEFLPALRDVKLLEDRPVRTGLRPAHEGGVLLHREPGTRIVHNTGHGGSGVTLSWGCADEVLTILTEVLA